MTLKVQMELQEELSRQLQLQKKLQGEMESLMSTHAEVRDESTSTNSKMGGILALKRKLQHELQAHLRMQHQCEPCNAHARQQRPRPPCVCFVPPARACARCDGLRTATAMLRRRLGATGPWPLR